MVKLETDHLTLFPLTTTQLDLYLTEPATLETLLKLPLSRAIITPTVIRAIGMKLTRMARTEPERHVWYTYWLVVIKAQNYGAGLFGFKGYPNQMGEVEIGYGLDSAYQNCGYTTEGVAQLISWAFRHPVCQVVVADPKKSNIASNRVLQKAGMSIYAETNDKFLWRIEKQK